MRLLSSVPEPEPASKKTNNFDNARRGSKDKGKDHRRYPKVRRGPTV